MFLHRIDLAVPSRRDLVFLHPLRPVDSLIFQTSSRHFALTRTTVGARQRNAGWNVIERQCQGRSAGFSALANTAANLKVRLPTVPPGIRRLYMQLCWSSYNPTSSEPDKICPRDRLVGMTHCIDAQAHH
jgi:hypothetical protein